MTWFCPIVGWCVVYGGVGGAWPVMEWVVRGVLCVVLGMWCKGWCVDFVGGDVAWQMVQWVVCYL